MSEVKRDYKIGYGKPPRGRPYQKGQSGNPRGPRRKDMSSLLIAVLNEPVYATIDGKPRRITKRQAIITQRCGIGLASRSRRITSRPGIAAFSAATNAAESWHEAELAPVMLESI